MLSFRTPSSSFTSSIDERSTIAPSNDARFRAPPTKVVLHTRAAGWW